MSKQPQIEEQEGDPEPPSFDIAMREVISRLQLSDEDQRVVLSAFQVIRAEVEYHSGPMPAISYLKGLNQLADNGAERILATYEMQVEHRIQYESRGQWHAFLLTALGQLFGFVVILAILVMAYSFMQNGSGLVEFAAIVTSLAAIAGIFAYVKRRDKQDSSG
ncbi:MAG: DUF2335 domain-containing protein [Caldilineae bacterium]|nr:DUF2335 domain-containing protein [Caldilineae bacterium]